VQLAIADAAESVDHLGDPEHALRIAMTRQADCGFNRRLVCTKPVDEG
jgi:hypothetical protein